MKYKIEYIEEYAGARVTANQDGAQYTNRLQDYATVYSAAKGDVAILSGYYVQESDIVVYLQTTSGVWIIINTEKKWNLTYNVETIPTHTYNQAQSLVNQIIANNKIIIANNLLCARYANRLDANQRKMLFDLQTRLQNRNAELANEGLVEQTKTGYPQEYYNLQPYLDKFMASGGVGLVVSATAIIIVSAVVIASLSTAAYFAYSYYAEESKKDVKYSQELTAALQSKLTAEEYQQLLNETAGLLTKEKIKANIGGATAVVKYGLIAAAGVLLYMYLKKGKKEQQ